MTYLQLDNFLRCVYMTFTLKRVQIKKLSTKSIDLNVWTVILRPRLWLTSGGSWPKTSFLANFQKFSPSYQAPVWTQSMEMQTLLDFTCFCRQRYRQMIRKVFFLRFWLEFKGRKLMRQEQQRHVVVVGTHPHKQQPAHSSKVVTYGVAHRSLCCQRS